MKLQVLVAVCLLVVLQLEHASAGRRFSEELQDFVVDLFTNPNPRYNWNGNNRLIWEDNHRLAAFSSRFSRCDQVSQPNGTFDVYWPRSTIVDVNQIGALRDKVEAWETNWEDVTERIKEGLVRWIQTREFRQQIEIATRFGCSSRPGCSFRNRQYILFNCLFTPRLRRGFNNL